MSWFHAALVFCGGAFLAIQAGINVTLGRAAGGPIWAALISFAIGTLCLLAVQLAGRAPWPTAAGLAAAPWTAWIGGALGAFYVSAIIVAAPRLGAAATIGFVIAGQVLTSLVIDQFGLLGFAQQAITPARALGAVLLVAGVLLIRLF
ncbi:MAG TPA: DMT family transporter [Alphaproteobacteria bacterium]|nr:DMT family transporter [Alphaproteobacteria bacterium]